MSVSASKGKGTTQAGQQPLHHWEQTNPDKLQSDQLQYQAALYADHTYFVHSTHAHCRCCGANNPFAVPIPSVQQIAEHYSFCKSVKSRREDTHVKCSKTKQTMLCKAAAQEHLAGLAELPWLQLCVTQVPLQAVLRRPEQQQQLSEYLTFAMNEQNSQGNQENGHEESFQPKVQKLGDHLRPVLADCMSSSASTKLTQPRKEQKYCRCHKFLILAQLNLLSYMHTWRQLQGVSHLRGQLGLLVSEQGSHRQS